MLMRCRFEEIFPDGFSPVNFPDGIFPDGFCRRNIPDGIFADGILQMDFADGFYTVTLLCVTSSPLQRFNALP